MLSKRQILAVGLISGLSTAFWLMPLDELAALATNKNIVLAQQDDLAEAYRLYQEGQRLYQEGSEASLRQAIEIWKQSVSLWQTAGAKREAGVVLNDIGFIYEALGESENALDYYQQSLALRRTVGDRQGEAITLSNIGKIYDSLGERETALEYYQQALALSRAVGDRQQEATTLSNIGVVYQSLGELETALDYYQQALPLHQAVENYAGEATTLSNIGKIYDDSGEKATALEYYQQALLISQAVNDRRQEAVILINIGSIYDGLGERELALDAYQQSLSLAQFIGDRFHEAVALSNIGVVYNATGERETALDYYQKSLALRQVLGDRAGEATTLNNIGNVYDALGEKEIAIGHYQQALSLNRAVGNRAGEATTLNNMGSVYDDLGEWETALDYYQQALRLSQAVGNRVAEAAAFHNIGNAYDALGETEKALDYYQQSLPLSRAIGNRLGEAVTLNNIGYLYSALEEWASALEYLQKALPLSQAVGDRQQEATTLGNLAVLYHAQGQSDAALNAIDDAIKLLEDLRLAISPGELRSSYFATVQVYYQLKTELLMQLGRPEEAFETSEASRARVLIELLSEANVDIRQGVDPELLEQEQALKTELQTIESRRIALRSGEYTQAEAVAIDQESEAVLQQLENTLAEIRQASPAYADTVQPRPLTLAQIQQQVLDDDTVLMQYALGEDQSYLWIVGKDQFQSVVLPGREEINTAARNFRNALVNPGSAGFIKRPAQALTAMILPELPAWTQGKRLLIAGDGVLAEVPFAALAVPGAEQYEPLLSQHEILSQPSISAVSVLRQQLGNRPDQPLSVAVLADPVYGASDQRLNQKANAELPQDAERNLRDMDLQAIAPLPFTRTEANNILALAQQRGIPALSAFDFEANYDWVTDPQLNQYSVLHLATHGFINPVNPQLSGIVLSLVDEQGQLRDDGFLRLHDIFNLRLAAELVVLSACQTGRGENVSGEGIIGLSRGFMYAGAERVAVSLWNVNDEATAALMSGLYGHLLEDGLTPAAALRAAQLDQWQAGQSPYYWAAFTLQGEWR